MSAKNRLHKGTKYQKEFDDIKRIIKQSLSLDNEIIIKELNSKNLTNFEDKPFSIQNIEDLKQGLTFNKEKRQELFIEYMDKYYFNQTNKENIKTKYSYEKMAILLNEKGILTINAGLPYCRSSVDFQLKKLGLKTNVKKVMKTRGREPNSQTDPVKKNKLGKKNFDTLKFNENENRQTTLDDLENDSSNEESLNKALYTIQSLFDKKDISKNMVYQKTLLMFVNTLFTQLEKISNENLKSLKNFRDFKEMINLFIEESKSNFLLLNGRIAKLESQNVLATFHQTEKSPAREELSALLTKANEKKVDELVNSGKIQESSRKVFKTLISTKIYNSMYKKLKLTSDIDVFKITNAYNSVAEEPLKPIEILEIKGLIPKILEIVKTGNFLSSIINDILHERETR